MQLDEIVSEFKEIIKNNEETDENGLTYGQKALMWENVDSEIAALATILNVDTDEVDLILDHYYMVNGDGYLVYDDLRDIQTEIADEVEHKIELYIDSIIDDMSAKELLNLGESESSGFVIPYESLAELFVKKIQIPTVNKGNKKYYYFKLL